MAKVKTNLFSELRKSAGDDLTFRTYNKSKVIFFQSKPTPRYTRSERQNEIRKGYGRLSDLYKKDGLIDFEVYDNIAKARKITRWNAFIRMNQVVMSEDPVLFLGMDEGGGTIAHDYSRFSNDGTIYGATWEKLPTGKSVLSFDGIDDYVGVPDSPELNPKEVSLITWVKMIEKPIEYSVFIIGKVAQYWFEWRETKQLSLSMRFTDGTYDGSGFTVDLNDGDWHFLGLTYDGIYKIGYHNGEQKSKTEIGKTINTTTYMFRIGNEIQINTGYNACPKGFIGLGATFNKALSENKINKIYEITKEFFKE